MSTAQQETRNSDENPISELPSLNVGDVVEVVGHGGHKNRKLTVSVVKQNGEYVLEGYGTTYQLKEEYGFAAADGRVVSLYFDSVPEGRRVSDVRVIERAE